MKYFEWMNLFEKNNCALTRFKGGKIGELTAGVPLAGVRPDPYGYSMDDEYRKNVRLTDNLYNDQDAIVASPRLRDLLVEKLGAKIEALPVWIKDHKGRIATKDYTFINILDVQDCLAVEESQASFGTIGGKQVVLGVEDLTLDLKRVSADARLFRLPQPQIPMLIREDLKDEIVSQKFQGLGFNLVKTI